jgi:5'-3' exonuclease
MTEIIVAKKHPVILIDNSYYIFNRYFATVRWFKQRQEDFELNHENIIENKEFIIAFIKHFETDIKKLTKKFKTIKSNIIFCIDCPRSTIWRNNIYDKYKQSRIKKDNFNSDIFDLFENYLNVNKFQICKYDNLEADDVVFLMQKKLNTINELKIIIITNDGDYLQMYSNNVKIFNMQLKDLSLKINYNPAIELLLKIIMGDKSDNIPKIQAGMRKDNALKIALMSEDDRIKYLTLHNMLDNFNLNKNLIDLDEIPEIIVKNFYEYYNISIQ